MLQNMNKKMKKPLIVIVIMLFLANTFISVINSVPKRDPAPPVSYSFQDNHYGNQLPAGMDLQNGNRQ
jgi:hypothetical protein